MILFQIICILINLILAFILHNCREYDSEESIKIRLKYWIGWALLTLIPIISCITAVIMGIVMILLALDGDLIWNRKINEDHWLNKRY